MFRVLRQIRRTWSTRRRHDPLELRGPDFVFWQVKLEGFMSRIVMLSIAAAVVWATPAAAQYRFDPRVDPQVCSWRQICDYGGRAYIPHRWVHRTSAVVHRRWHAPGCGCVPITPDW